MHLVIDFRRRNQADLSLAPVCTGICTGYTHGHTFVDAVLGISLSELFGIMQL